MKSSNSKKQEEDKYRIFDDIYGLVKFNETEKRIIDSPFFQRLRRIKQLGLAHLVFPGAMHTRFSHSIGALAIAQRVAQALDFNSDNERKLRMAALLHDVGHFPLSHTIEKVYSDERKKIEQESQQEKLRINKDTSEPLRKPILIESIKLHEEMSAKVVKGTNFEGGITEILLDSEVNPTEIANIIVGRHQNNLFNQLMHSEVDIDQMDYLIRDAKNAGITYGTCDVDYLISNMVNTKYNDSFVLFFDMKALRALEHFFMARYFYFTQILYHKTRSVIEYCARELYAIALNQKLKTSGQRVFQYTNLDGLYKSKSLSEFDDSYFDGVLRAIAQNTKDRRVKRYADVIMQRKIPTSESEKFETLIKGDKQTARQINHNTQRNNEISIEEEFDILTNYEQIKKRTSWSSEDEILYGDRESVRLIISEKYSFDPKRVFLCNFPDTILSKLVNCKFIIKRKYKFR